MKVMASTLAISCFVFSCCHAGAQTSHQGDESDRRAGRSPDTSAATTETTASQSVDLERQIIWHPDRPTEAAFLPELLLQEEELSALPLTKQQRETIARMIDQRRNPKRHYPPVIVERGIPCLENQIGATHERDRSEDAGSLTDLVLEAPIALVGQVVNVVHGKDDLPLGVGRIIYIEVKEIISVAEAAMDGSPKLGDVVAVLKEGGSIKIGGVAICEKVPGEFHQPEIADWLLVLGEPPSSGSPLIRRSQTFPINEGEVLPQPYYGLRPGEKPKALSAIRSEVQAGGSSPVSLVFSVLSVRLEWWTRSLRREGYEYLLQT